jgi:hypothetical protein
VALPLQEGPDGRKLKPGWFVTLNDAGMVVFLAGRENDPSSVNGAYLWENGTVTSVATRGMDVPVGGKISNVYGAWVNNKNRNVLVDVSFNGSSHALCLYSDGKLTPVAAPGQPMPNGGTFKRLPNDFQVSVGNDLGQHAFTAEIIEEDQTRTAAYLMQPDGQLSLVLKSGTMTDMGEITNVGTGGGISTGIGLNNKGQMALTLRVAGLPVMLTLLAPTTP